MSVRERIGIFGGTFDPVHNAHLEIARAALKRARLDRVLFVVAARPPHKLAETAATPQDRYDLVSAAVADEEGMAVSDIELRRDGPSYTVDTLEELATQQPDADLFLIVGADALADFPDWKEPRRILELARLLVVSRPGEEMTTLEGLDGHYDPLPFPEFDLSSTDIRNRLASGESLDGLVPESVIALIRTRDLYAGVARHSPRG